MPDTERELFESAMSNEPEATPVKIVEEAPETAQQPEKPEGEKPRDEKGGFAPKAEAEPEQPTKAKEPERAKEPEQKQETPAEQAPALQPEKADHRVPLAELLSTRDRAQKAEQRAEENERALQNVQRQMAQLHQQFQQSQKPEVPKPNLFENPDQWEQSQQQGIQSLLQQQTISFSEQLARIKYGDETYDAADKAAQQVMASGQLDPTLVAVGKSQNPGVALVEWHKRKLSLEKLGNLDPDKFVEQEIEKRLNDPQFLAKAVEKARAQAQAQPGPATQKPVTTIPSLNRQTSAASNATDDEDESDAALFKSALRR